MKTWLQSYIAAQHRAVDSLPLDAVAKATETAVANATMVNPNVPNVSITKKTPEKGK